MTKPTPPPPPFTCPTIDATKRAIRRARWRILRVERLDEAAAQLAEALVLLEAVREDNRRMRAAYVRAVR